MLPALPLRYYVPWHCLSVQLARVPAGARPPHSLVPLCPLRPSCVFSLWPPVAVPPPRAPSVPPPPEPACPLAPRPRSPPHSCALPALLYS